MRTITPTQHTLIAERAAREAVTAAERRPRRVLRRRLARGASTLVAAGAAFALVGAPSALAESIAYVKDGSVWLSTADGSRQFQVTNGGGYTAVSQSDDGHLSALHGDQIAYLDQAGNVLADIKTPVSTTTDPTKSFQGPFDPVISPDGKTVAYTYYYQYTGYDPYCNPSTGCYLKRLYQGVAYTSPTALTEWDAPGMRRQSGWIHPFWVGSDRTFASNPSMSPNEDMIMNEIGKDDKTGFTRWFSHPDAKWWKDSDMTRSQKKLAGVAGENSELIWFAYVQGLPENGGKPNYPKHCLYEINGPAGGKFEQVSWSPAGNVLSYSDGAGINTVAIPEFGATYGDCGQPTENTKLIIPGGKSPSFGPADVPAPRTFPPTTGGGNGGGTGSIGKGGGNGTGNTPGAGGGETTGGGIVIGGGSSGNGGTAKPVKLGKVLSGGLPLTVQIDTPGQLTVTVKAKGKTVGTSKGKAGKAGPKTVKVPLTKTARKSLAKAKSVTFTVTTSLKPAGGGKAVRQTVKLTVTR